MKIHSKFFRTSFSVSGLILMAVLAAGVPKGLAAQESAAQAAAPPTTAPSTAAPEAPKAEERKSQEEQNKVFLLEGPIVKWTAKTFGITNETASAIFQFINFGVIVLLVGIPVVRVLPKIFHKRTQTLGANLKTAREATADANARLSAVEAKLAGLDDEIKKFRSEVERESLEDEARIKASLAEESARIVQAAEQELTVAAQQARRGLRNFAAGLAIEQAAKQLVLTPETDKALIAEFVGQVSREAASKVGQKGGQN